MLIKIHYLIINMSSLSSYYIFSSLLFFLLCILDYIVYNEIRQCPYDTQIGILFLIIGLLNTFIFINMLYAGFLIRYFSKKTSEDLNSMNIFFVILSVGTKLSQKITKILHLLKFILTIILSILFIIEYFKTSTNTNTCTNPKSLKDNNVILLVLIFESMSFFVSFILFGIIKSFLNEESFIYNPEFQNQYCCTKLIFHTLGP
jgi:hypothetical protein